jgi:hypothetical protein
MSKKQQNYLNEAGINHRNANDNMFNDGSYQTPYPHTQRSFSSYDEQVIDYDYNMPVSYFELYCKENKIQEDQLCKYCNEYKKDKVDTDEFTMVSFLQEIIDTGKLEDNNILYEEIVKFLEYAVSNNMLNKKKSEFYKKNFQKALFANNKYEIDNRSDKYVELDYSTYEDNNFRKDEENEILNTVYEENGAIYLNKNGKICIKIAKNNKAVAFTPKEAKIVLTSRLGLDVQITETTTTDDEDVDIHELSIYSLLLVVGTIFKPYVLKEYLYQDGVYYQNLFKPSKYLKVNGKPLRLPKAILDLLFNLVDYNTTRYNYLLNWLAFFFKYLQKSQVAIALIGDQGTGKGILFDIISKLFGEEYCITINDESLNSKYKAKMIANILFYNFDEIKFNTCKKNDSFLKAVITNPSVSLEEKNVTMEKEVELYGQCLFTSNNLKALYLNESDRRYTIFNTGSSLLKTNYLNFGSYENLEMAINDELEDFAKYLKNFDVDIALANTALDTPEKRMIINASKDNLKDFHTAIINKHLEYFEELSETNIPLYTTLYSDFNKNRIDRSIIRKAYNELFSGRDISTKELMSKLREIQPYDTFTEVNMFHSGNTHFYKLP